MTTSFARRRVSFFSGMARTSLRLWQAGEMQQGKGLGLARDDAIGVVLRGVGQPEIAMPLCFVGAQTVRIALVDDVEELAVAAAKEQGRTRADRGLIRLLLFLEQRHDHAGLDGAIGADGG